MNSGALKRTLVADLQYDPKFSDCKDEFSAFPGLRRNAQSRWPKMSSLIAQK